MTIWSPCNEVAWPRSAVVCLLAGLVAAGASVAAFVHPAGADELLGYDMSADARGLQIFTLIPDQQVQPELNIPQASVIMQSGTGYGLASAAWPGAIIANGGSLSGSWSRASRRKSRHFSSTRCGPRRAPARTRPPPCSKHRGSRCVRAPTTTSAEAEAAAQGLRGLPGVFGAASTTSRAVATDSGATSTARSVIHNLNIGGVLKIDQIVSTATAKSDGITGSGSAKTVITGATVMAWASPSTRPACTSASTNQPIDAIVNQLTKLHWPPPASRSRSGQPRGDHRRPGRRNGAVRS